MDEKIIAAAHQCGAFFDIVACGRHDGVLMTPSELARFYALAYRQGLEDAAKLLETKKEWRGGKWVSSLSPETASAIAAAIRALKEKDHG